MKWRTAAALLAALALAAPLAAQTAPAGPGKMRVGMNANWTDGDQVAGMFSDQMMAGAPWQLNGANAPAGPLAAGSVRNARLTSYPGVHTLKATGKGTISLYARTGLSDPGNLRPTATPNLYTAAFTGSETYTFTPIVGPLKAASLTVQATDATAPLSRVQVLAPGAGTGLYHPSYLGALAPFSAIRTMDSQNVVASKEVHWSDRNTQYGHDLEALIALGNQLGKDLWICIPARAISANGAPTDYCYALGDLLNAVCDPSMTVYAELSDEVWNDGLPWVDETVYIFGQAPNEYELIGGRQAYARAAHKAFQAISSRIGPYGPKLKRVYGAQLGNVGTVDPSLPWAVGKGYRYDALAGGMYWGMAADIPTIKAKWAAGDQAGALALIDQGYRAGVATMLTYVKQFAVYSQRYGMELVAYEGGPSTDFFRTADTAPIMAAYFASDLCRQQHVDALKAMEQAGVSLFMYYSYSHVNPAWGSRVHAGDLANGRYRGLLEYIVGAPPAVFAGQDATTRGNWVGAYGSLGSTLAGAPASPAPLASQAVTLPAPAVAAKQVYTYQAPGTTTDPRAPQLADGSGNRLVAAWIDPSELTVDVPGPADGGQYLLSLYILDWPDWAGGVSETVAVLDAATGAVLDSKSLTGLSATPLYLRWAVQGHVRVKVTATARAGAVLSGVFLDPVPSP